MMKQTPLFCAQAYHDAWDDYLRSLNQPDFARWDYIILTASNEQQAEAFRAQLRRRESIGRLPPHSRFAVVADPGGRRVGSGGATLNVLRYIADCTGRNDFSRLRILCIHSGGDSKRAPQYSVQGKLFSPIPRELPDGRASTLFDELLIGMSGVPARIREGMLLLSGDVLPLFNPLQLSHPHSGAAAISFRESEHTGKNHGVFLRGKNGFVARFLHKQSITALRAAGAVDARGMVNIDTGALLFSPDLLAALYGLVAPDEAAFKTYVSEELRLSLYGDFLYPLAEDSTLAQFYLEAGEGMPGAALTKARTAIWHALRPFRMKLLSMSPAKFIHMGTTREILRLMHDEIDSFHPLGWRSQTASAISQASVPGCGSILAEGSRCGSHCHLEFSHVHRGSTIGENVLLSHVELRGENIPPNTLLHVLKLQDGHFVARICGVTDDPKKALLFGTPLDDFCMRNGLPEQEIWRSDEEHSLWTARLYPICRTPAEAIAAALNLHAMAHGGGNPRAWRFAARESLSSSFCAADCSALLDWETHMQELVQMEQLAGLIRKARPASQAAGMLRSGSLSSAQQAWLREKAAELGFADSLRLYRYTGCALGGSEGERLGAECFRALREAILTHAPQPPRAHRIAMERHRVRLPLRVNWAGGWTDTPPYCIEHGGTVLNAAILLKGRLPVEVTLARLEERTIVFDSRDMDAHAEFDATSGLQFAGDPGDPFSLQKAALLVCGIIPPQGGDLQEILGRIGGGFRLQTEVTDVPKGSGLGTSSILAAACVKCILEFMGESCTDDMLYSRVLCMEQLMSTGGGWQDQAGGLHGGIKLISSEPGLAQTLRIEQLQIPSRAMTELRRRFVLISTGQRRLARNLLRSVIRRYLGREGDSLAALHATRHIAIEMRTALEAGDIDGFARLLGRQWELSKQIDPGSTNALIEEIFRAIEDCIDGRMICGAGGGGFLQAILKKDIFASEVQRRLEHAFPDSGIRIWDCTIL